MKRDTWVRLGHVFTLLLIVIIGGLSVSPLLSQGKSNEAKKLNVGSTLLVYPAAIGNSSFTSPEHAIVPDLDEHALYQDFSTSNSASILEKVNEQEASYDNDQQRGGTQTQDTPADENASASDAFLPGVEDQGTGSEVVTEEETNAPSETEPEVVEPEVEEEEVTEEAPEQEEPQEVEDAQPETSEGTALKNATESFFAFFGTVSEIFPFVNTQEQTALVENVNEEAPEQEEAVEETVEVVPEVPEENILQEEPALDVVENTEVLETNTASNTPLQEGGVDELEQSEQIAPSSDTDAATQNGAYTLLLEDFSAPALERGESIAAMQLRLSLGASYEVHANTPLPSIDVLYHTGSSTELVGSILLDGEVSNALNGGYFLYALPQIAQIGELENVAVELAYRGDTENLEGLFIDAAWLEIEVEKIDRSLLLERAENDLAKKLLPPEKHTLLSETLDFARGELPDFSLRYNSQRNIAVRFVRDLLGHELAEIEQVRFVHRSGGTVLFPEAYFTDEGLLTLQLKPEDTEKLTPGEYTVELSINEGGTIFTDSFSFQWGLLAINPNKTAYEVGEVADMHIGSLSPNGNTVCDARLRLYIIDDQDVVYPATVEQTGACDGNNVTDTPDYTASFTPTHEGVYTMYLERLNEQGEVISHTNDTFEVYASLALSLERKGPTRIYPLAAYPMEITVTAKEAWEGQLIEEVPYEIAVTETDASLSREDDVRFLTWDVALEPGESQTFSYVFDTPDLSPFLYTLGTARLSGSFTGERAVEENIQPDTTDSAVTEGVVEVPVVENPSTEVPDEEVVPEEVQEAAQESFIDSLIELVAPQNDDSSVVEPNSVEIDFDAPELLTPSPEEQVSATDIETTGDFEEHRQWQIASDATGNMVVYWDGTSIPTGWTCLSCGSGTFYQRFALGSTTYNTTGGATTHTHTGSGSVIASSAATTESGSGTAAPVSHSHTYTPTIGSASNLPLYRQLRAIQYTGGAGEPPSLPTGAIGIFDASVPSGWTRYSAQDGYYIYAENTPGTTGGSNTHTHAISGNTGAASGSGTRTRGGGAASAASQTHTHSVSGSTASQSIEPPYIEVILGKLDATSTAPNGLITMWTEDVPSGWLDKSTPSEPFYNRFIKGAASYGATGGGASHTPADVNGLTSGTPSALSGTNHPAGTAGASGSHTHTVNVTGFSTTSNLPPFLTVVYGKRQGTNPVYEQLSYRWYVNENNQTPSNPWPQTGTDLLEGQPIAAVSTPVKSGEVVRLRMNVEVSNATSSAATFKLQYGAAPVCSAVSVWTDVAPTSSSTALWRGYNNATPADHSTLASTTLASTTVGETYEENGYATTTPNDVSVGDVGEWDFVLQHNGAQAGTEYCFRMVEGDGTPFSAYTSYPQLLTNYAPEAPTQSVPFDNEKVATTTPTFEFVTSDAEGEDIHYEIEIDNDYDFSSPTVDHNSISQSTRFENLVVPTDKSPFTQGQLIAYELASPLTNNTTYWYRVRAQDPSGSNSWGAWSTPTSFTIDTSLTASAWFQTTDEQFDTNTLLGVESTGSDSVSLISGSSTGSMIGNPIDFDDGSAGTAWGELQFTDVETTGDIKYQIEYLDNTDTWTLIPNADLSGNSTGFDTSPVSLLNLDTDTYNTIRIVADLTNSGGAPTLSDWTLEWGYRVETPTITSLFPNERTGTTTPTFIFETSDPQSDSLTYQISWSTDNTFTSSTTRTSDSDGGFTNADDGLDSDPFNSGDTIYFTVESGDALTNNTTYWYRVRAKDTTGDDAYSFWTDPQSFTVTTGTTVSTWYQTTEEQFESNILSGTVALSNDTLTVATTASEAIIVYGQGVENEPRYRTWNGSVWSSEGTLTTIQAPLSYAVVEAGVNREEYVAATIGTDNDVNVQVYSLGVWSTTTELTTNMGNITARGVDVAYESNSGDAIVVYCDGDGNPSYYVWNGSTWTSGGAVGMTLGNNCEWVQLASDPSSDEIIAMVRDSVGTGAASYEVRVWNGSSWASSATQGGARGSAYEAMALEYEDGGGQALSVSGDGNPARFEYNSWNGTTWAGLTTQAITDNIMFGQLAQDDGTDAMTLCYIDESNEVRVIRWTGAAWAGAAQLDATANASTDRAVSCAYETTSGRDGYSMVAYSDATNARYQFWNGTTWSGEATLSTITDASTVQLKRTGNGLILGTFFDDVNDRIDFSSWNGSTWSSLQTLESDASVGTTPFGEPFMIATRNSGTEGTTVVSPGIDFYAGSGPYWDEFSWTDTTPGSSDIRYSVQYYDGDSWEFIPDGDLSGNAAGFTTSPVDLSSLDVTTYDLIRPYAELTCQNPTTCPTLSDWQVTWAEGITVSGTALQYNQSSNVTSGTVAVAVNGVIQSGKTSAISGGTWSIDNVTVFPGDVVSVFISSAVDASEAVAVSKYDGSGDMTGFELIERHVSIGSNDGQTITNANLGLYDFTNTEDIFYDVDGGNDLTACATSGCGDVEIYIKAGNTYRPGAGGNATTHDIENNGTLTLNGNTLRVSGSWDNSATFTAGTSTVIFTATSTSETLDQTGASLGTFNNLTFGETSGSATWSLSNTLDVDGTLTVARGTLARGVRELTLAGNLTINANGVFTGMGTTTFDGATAAVWTDQSSGPQNIGRVVVDGTSKTITLGGNVAAQTLTIGANDSFDLSPSNYDITVYSHWINNNSFNARAGDVFFAATTTGRIIQAGGDNFYNISFTGVGGGWSFTESTLGVGNDFAITAAGTVTMPTATTTISGSFNNSAGTFAHNNASLLFNSSGAETLTLSGGAFTNAFYNVRFQGSGSWTFTESNATTTNRFAIAQGTVTFPSNTLSIGDSFLNTGGTFAHNNGTVRFTSSGTETIDTNASFSNLLFSGSGTWSFVDTNVTALGDLTITSGTVTLPSGTLTLGGSLTNSATLTHNSGTVLFNSTDTGETVALGGSSLYNATFNSGTGGWTITENATTTNNTTLTAASSFTLDSGRTLSVGATFTNSVGGGATTWAGSTLSLEAGNYSINTKSTGGDAYGTLRVRANTDIKMWNSSASSYSVDATGSLYSQDHNAVDGDLYVFGNYPRSSGVEYWSYATDFDGTALGGGSRQVDVRFASGASASFTNSTLDITGTAGASTTIANQGSGTYTLSVSGGTTTAAYYAFEHLGSTGVSLLDGTHVSSLANGAFTLSTNAGTGLTVSSTTVDANPGLQIYDVSFATSSVITTANVTQTGGAPASYWWFRDSYGNVDGEAYDSDTGDPGSIRWDDSSLVITVSGTVYEDDRTTPLAGGTCDGSTNVVRVVVEGGATYNGTCSNIDGSYSIGGVVVVGDPTLTVFLNDASGGEKAVAVTKTPTADITDLDLYVGRVITRHEDISAMSIEDMVSYDSSNDSDVLFSAATGTPNILTLVPDSELFVWATTTFAPGGDVTLNSGGTGEPYDGSLYIANGATWTGAGTSTYSVGGTFTLSSAATFVPASTTVAMTATTSGKAIAVASGETASFNLLRFTGVGGGWNVNGDIEALDDIELAQGTVTGTGDITIPYGSFYGNGLLSLGGGTTTIERSNTLGGTQGWTFYNLALGNGSVVGTTTPASTATTTVAGVLTLRTAHFFDAGASALNLSGVGTVFIEQGTFLEDTSTVRYSGAGATNIRSTGYYNLILDALAGSPTYTATGLGIVVGNDLTIGGANTTTVTFDTSDPALDVNGDFTIASNGTFIASNSGSFTLAGNYDNNGTFTGSGGTLTFDGGGASNIAAGSSSFSTVVINNAGGTFTITENATTTGAFTLTNASSFTLNSGLTLAVGGTLTNSVGGGATTWTGSTLSLYSGTNYVMNPKTVNDAYNVLRIGANTDARMWNSSAASYVVNTSGSLYSMNHSNVAGDLYIYGNYPGNGGTDHWSYATDFDGTSLGGGSRQVDVRFQSGASMSLVTGGLSVIGTASASTSVQNQGSGTYGLLIGGTASTTWNYYDIEDTNSAGLTFTGTPNIVSLSYGDIEVSQNAGSGMTVGGTVLNTNPAKNFTVNGFSTTTGITASNVTATGTSVSSWRFTNHYGTIDGESYDTDPDGNPGYIVWDDSAATITISGNVYSDEGVTVSGVCDGSTNNVHVRVAGLTSYTTNCNATTGAYSISGVNYTVGDSLVVYIDGETEKGATVTEDPISNIGNLHIYENRVIVRHEGVDPLSIADMAIWDSSDDADIPFTAVDASPDTLTLPSDRKLIVWNNKTFAPGGNVTLSNGGSQAYGGTLELYSGATWTSSGAQTHSIGGSLIAQAGATFTPANSSVTFTSSGAARTIDVNNGSFYDVSFTGSGSWTITDTTFDINAFSQSNGTLTLPAGTTTVSAGWSKTGGSFVASGPMVFDGTGTHSITFGGSNAGPLYVTGSGTFTMTDTNATSTGAFIKTAGSVTLPSGILALSGSFDNQAGTITHNTSLIKIATSSVAFVRASSSDLYGVTFQGGGTYSFADTSLSLLDDLTLLSGSMTLASGTLSIGGSLSAQGGTFTHASGTVLFNSSDTGETVNPGSSPFYNVVFSGAGGGWTMSASATTTNNFSLTLGSSYTQTSGTTLYVANVFQNAIGGSATTWTGSTLILDSGSNYSINSKSTGGDHYQTLVVGADTDIRAWNSRATTTNVHVSGSLYSQDHAAFNGELYIYGDFHVATTTEYWSYATDFDGTSLSGSERAVTVRIANNSTTTVESGTLNIVGASGNSTTITNQGSGTFAFGVEGGTFNALYYAFRNLNADGLVLSQTPTLSSLSQGDFELAVNGGSLMTLFDETLDANASKVISGMRFATTSAITGANVTLVGSTTNAWSFVSHTGNLSGEDYDIDGATACGSLRWSDSACLLTQQTHYRWRHDDGGLGVPNSEWFNASWDARKSIRLANDDATTYTDAVVKLTVAYDADMQVDFDDLRFTDESGTTTIPYFIDTYSASTEATVWVQVPSLQAEDITTIFMYFDNAGASSQSSSTQTFIAADDFEDGSLSEYNGETGIFTVGTSFAYGGTYGLDAFGHEEDKANYGIGRTDMTISQGQTIRYMQYVDTTDGGDEVCTLFAVQGSTSNRDNYAVCLEQVSGTDRMSIVQDAESTDQEGSVIQLATTSVAYTTGWYEVEIDWLTNDDINVALYEDDGTLVATTTANDTTYSSGGFGFTYWYQHGGWDNFVVRPYLENEPTVYFGAKQTDGGASWAAAMDDAASYVTGDIARLRLSIENTGLEITDQTFDLEFALKGAAPSCEAVPSGNYSSVPPQSSCGTSPLCMQTTSYYGDGASTADLLFDTEGEFVAGYAIEDPSNTTPNITIGQNEYTELEYAITPTINATSPAYCLRATNAGDPVDTYLSVAELNLRFDPVVTNVRLNNVGDISLVSGTTTRVYATGTVSDQNGYTDLVNATSTIYRSGAGPACSADNNSCYISTAPICSFTDCAGNSCTVSCYADIFFHADATDASPYEGEEWLAHIEVSDQNGGIDIGTVAEGVEVFTLQALNVTAAINYGSLAVSSTTGSYNPTTTVQNIGNVPIDIQIEGSDLTDGGSSFIPANEQIFATSTFDYTSCVACSALSSTTLVPLEVELTKPTSETPPITDVVYWGIEIPFGVASNPHSGTNIFYAVGE